MFIFASAQPVVRPVQCQVCVCVALVAVSLWCVCLVPAVFAWVALQGKVEFHWCCELKQGRGRLTSCALSL